MVQNVPGFSLDWHVFGNMQTGERAADSYLPDLIGELFTKSNMHGFTVYSIRRSAAHWAFACSGDIHEVMNGFNWAMLENAARYGI